MRVLGKVTASSLRPAYIYVDDGSGVQDETSIAGLRIWLPATTTSPPALGAYVMATGVTDQNLSFPTPYPALRVGRASDVVVIKP